jgi:hypothetical protein
MNDLMAPNTVISEPHPPQDRSASMAIHDELGDAPVAGARQQLDFEELDDRDGQRYQRIRKKFRLNKIFD